MTAMFSRISGFFATIFFFVLYIFTLAPGVLTADNAEFQLIATNLGVAHPPGFPLYTLLGHLATWLPFGPTPAYRLNLFSALTSTLTLLFVYMAVQRLTKSTWGAATAVLTLGTATTFWAQATTANIRSLTALFAAMTLYWLILWQGQREKREGRGERGEGRAESIHPPHSSLLLAIVSLSFGITHHVSLVFMGLVFALFVLVVDPGLMRRPKEWIRPFLLALLALLPLLYLPWRALAGANRAPARLATWDGFWNHVLARGFSGDFFYFIEPTAVWERLKIMGNVMTFQFHPLLLVGMIIGLLLMLRHNWKLALLCGGSFTLHTLITATYRAPQTVEYMLPAYVPAVICLGYGVGRVETRDWRLGRFASRDWQLDSVYRLLITVYGAALLLTALWQGWHNYPSFAELHQDTSASDYAQVLLDNAPPNSTILAHWHWATTLWYLQEAERQRPDVLTQFVFPTFEPYPETWARRVGDELANGRDVLTTHYDASFYVNLPQPEPIGDGYLFRQQSRPLLPANFVPLDLALADALTILGYAHSSPQTAVAQETTLTLVWQTENGLCNISNCQGWPVALFAHLVSADGVLVAQEDLTITPATPDIHLTQFRLTPRLGAAPGEYTLMIGAYVNSPEGIVPIGEARTAVSTLTVTAMARRPFTHNPVRYQNQGRTLVGYDWDNTLVGQPPRLYLHWQTAAGFVTEVRDVPEGEVTLSREAWGGERPFTLHNQPTHYVPFGQGIIWTGPLLDPQQPLHPGDTLILRQTFHSSQPIQRDINTSVRLVGYEADNVTWAWADLDEEFGVPAMGAIPTLKWIGGSAVHDPHQFTIPTTAIPGQRVGVLLNLYDAFTNRPIPVLDERFTPAQPWRESVISP
ncbi:MAG: DUF2723 domain-containing protein [Ardenticatenaceae bacterium]|nr:DUF2723 domain-containing protein [Ardenticatenaceae bacterium]